MDSENNNIGDNNDTPNNNDTINLELIDS